MGRCYSHLTIEDRCEVARRHAAGASRRQIAAALDRAPSTIARELKRNASRTQGYQPRYADQQAHARRWRGPRGSTATPPCAPRSSPASNRVGPPNRSPGGLARESGHPVISHESIYRFIDAQIRRTKDYAWRHFLPRAKAKRGRRGRKGGSSVSFIQHRRPLTDRPASAADRQVPGHWEADLMLFSSHRQAVLTLHDRHSRLLLAARSPSKAAAPIAGALTRLLTPLPAPWRQTVTFDNGTEFARHHQLHAHGIQTFFCEPHAPWQKGGIENAIGRLRRTLPRKTDLATLTPARFTQLVQAYNNTPRKCLGYQTPAEVFWDQPLHLKCESTFPPSETFE